MPAERIPLVALITDFGHRDPALVQFKAAALSVNPKIRFLDVSHEIRNRDLLEAAFLLERVYRDFPTRTYFVVMVEQFTAAPRRPLLSVSMDYYYFAPDNGVLSFVYASDPPSNVYHVTAEHYIEHPVPPRNVHRDVYGRALGWLAKGIDSSNFGERVDDYVKLQVPQAQRSSPQEIQGSILQVERHGTCVTNIRYDMINAARGELGSDKRFKAQVKEKPIPIVGGWKEGGPELIAIYGPTGFLEIIAPKGDASKILEVKRGEAVRVLFEA